LSVDLADWPDQQDAAEWPRLRQLIADALGSRTRDEWATVFVGTDSCVTPVLDFDEASANPHNAERGLLRNLGGTLHPAPAPRFSRTPARPVCVPTSEKSDLEKILGDWRASGLVGAITQTHGKDVR
jgi:alpha-methylacyl-CoA racemase